MRRLLFALVLLATGSGCSVPTGAPSAMVVVLEVPPFAAQVRSDDCASVALASLLAYHGREISAAEIDRQIYDPVLGGSLLLDLENYAAEQGAAPRSGRGDLTLLRSLLADGIPVLLPLDLGWNRWKRPHYVVVTGYGPQQFALYKKQGPMTTLSAAELERRWAGSGYLYLYLHDER
ncbi:MAG TPA: cysteine peptidase family C39 domain-containing protein [Geopsychrobacteraceae bacterium]|jgi:ABC-type bacteriocin/lantibiotic exporter with double-glycine peptidase domain